MINGFVVGDRVKILPETREHRIQMCAAQEQYVGRTAKITGYDTYDHTGDITSYRLDVDDGKYRWHTWMLERIQEQGMLFGVTQLVGEPTKPDLFREITGEMADLYERKNHDYGDSFGEGWREFGLTGSVIRLGDKYRRLRNLVREEAMVKDESIEDTLMDLANYAVMTLVEMRMSKP